MLPSMMSVRPVRTLSTVADHSISAGLAPSPSFCAIIAIISPSVPMSLPSLTLVIGMSPLIATVRTPGLTVLKLGAARPQRGRSPARAAPPMPGSSGCPAAAVVAPAVCLRPNPPLVRASRRARGCNGDSGLRASPMEPLRREGIRIWTKPPLALLVLAGLDPAIHAVEPPQCPAGARDSLNGRTSRHHPVDGRVEPTAVRHGIRLYKRTTLILLRVRRLATSPDMRRTMPCRTRIACFTRS